MPTCTINLDDLYIYDESGHKLPRTEVAEILDQINARLSRPVYVYLMADNPGQLLKVGISENVETRRYQLERAYSIQGLSILYETPALNRVDAGIVERGIHTLLSRLGRGPIMDKEWFTLQPHDVWLVRNILSEMPIKAAGGIFTTLADEYVNLVKDYKNHPDFVAEEIRIGFGTSLYYHFCKEVNRPIEEKIKLASG